LPLRRFARHQRTEFTRPIPSRSSSRSRPIDGGQHSDSVQRADPSWSNVKCVLTSVEKPLGPTSAEAPTRPPRTEFPQRSPRSPHCSLRSRSSGQSRVTAPASGSELGGSELRRDDDCTALTSRSLLVHLSMWQAVGSTTAGAIGWWTPEADGVGLGGAPVMSKTREHVSYGREGRTASGRSPTASQKQPLLPPRSPSIGGSSPAPSSMRAIGAAIDFSRAFSLVGSHRS
jgi:hypothetical protein